MKKLLLIHGPNLNQLGKRDPQHYGPLTLENIEHTVKEYAAPQGFEVLCFQSNHEGVLIDTIQAHAQDVVALIINPGALSHYSYALHDAIVDSQLPTVEVHLSNIKAREPWRAHSVIEPACFKTIIGKKDQGYIEAFDAVIEYFDPWPINTKD